MLTRDERTTDRDGGRPKYMRHKNCHWRASN